MRDAQHEPHRPLHGREEIEVDGERGGRGVCDGQDDVADVAERHAASHGAVNARGHGATVARPRRAVQVDDGRRSEAARHRHARLNTQHTPGSSCTGTGRREGRRR